jgi:nucleotide-binding universal stress UspA family protein
MKTRLSQKHTGIRVLIATDGSLPARAAVATARAFPWPRGSRVRGVVASGDDWVGSASSRMRRALAQGTERVVGAARSALEPRWPEAEVMMRKDRAVDGILREARRFRADVIVVGWRGHGAFRRLLMGSVSRGVVENAKASVLVVRRSVRKFRRFVIGIDGSPHARRAVDLIARLPHAGITVTVVRVVEPRILHTAGRLPASLRAVVLSELAAMNAALTSEARRDVDATAERLKRAGWAVRAEVWTGAPLASLLEVVDRTNADLLVVGARAKRGLKRALLGSVAAGALDRSAAPVLVVR